MKVNKSTLLELSFSKRNLHIHKEHFKENNILNIYQLNIFYNLLFLHRVKNGKAPNVFLSKFLRPSHLYPTSFSQNNYIVTSFKLTKSKYRITIHGPKLWNIILNIKENLIEKHANFKATKKTNVAREYYRTFFMHI